MNNRSILIAPSILSSDFSNLGTELKVLDDCGVDLIHLDIMDGSFVPRISFGDIVVSAVASATNIPLEAHLMVNHPETHFETLKKCGVSRTLIHQETCPHLHRDLENIISLRMECGVVINPGTTASSIYDVLYLCKVALVMTVNPGAGGQNFISSMIYKIQDLSSFIAKNNLNCLIEVDGGINSKTAKMSYDAGASIIVAGSYIANATDRKVAINSLRNL
jgi:ribulose-phosphate 3-epimerase